jgi:hypothetical protein
MSSAAICDDGLVFGMTCGRWGVKSDSKLCWAKYVPDHWSGIVHRQINVYQDQEKVASVLVLDGLATSYPPGLACAYNDGGFCTKNDNGTVLCGDCGIAPKRLDYGFTFNRQPTTQELTLGSSDRSQPVAIVEIADKCENIDKQIGVVAINLANIMAYPTVTYNEARLGECMFTAGQSTAKCFGYNREKSTLDPVVIGTECKDYGIKQWVGNEKKSTVARLIVLNAPTTAHPVPAPIAAESIQ